jgi:hypothetical protein
MTISNISLRNQAARSRNTASVVATLPPTPSQRFHALSPQDHATIRFVAFGAMSGERYDIPTRCAREGPQNVLHHGHDDHENARSWRQTTSNSPSLIIIVYN